MFNFYTNCVNWPHDDVDTDGGLCDLIQDRTTITRRTFLRHASREDVSALEEGLGYDPRGLRMSKDWHVEYFRSKLHGKTVYGFRHSAIEFVFTQESNR